MSRREQIVAGSEQVGAYDIPDGGDKESGGLQL